MRAIAALFEEFFSRFFTLSGEILLLFAQAIREFTAVTSAPLRVLRHMMEIGVRTLLLVSMIGLFEGMTSMPGLVFMVKELRLDAYERVTSRGSMTPEWTRRNFADGERFIITAFEFQRMTGLDEGIAIKQTQVVTVITAIIVTGRVGSAMAAEIGTMSVSEEIDALRVMGINPIRYIVTPRVFASIAVLPVLTMYSVVIGIWGGSIVSQSYLGVASTVYYDQVYNVIEFADIMRGLSKTLVFGAIFSTVCCYMGMTATNGAMGVGKNTTRAVVVSLTMILVSDYFMTRFI